VLETQKEVIGTDLRQAYQMFSELWKFYRTYQEVQYTDTYWKTVVEESEIICKRYESELCRDLVTQILKEFERKEKQENVSNVTAGQG
jgi:hypothetical protein